MDPSMVAFRALFDRAVSGGPAGLATFLGLCVLYARKAETLLEVTEGDQRAAHAPSGKLTPAQAVAKYPAIRLSFIYERGEDLGFATRVKGTRKVVVDEAALLRVLGPTPRGV